MRTERDADVEFEQQLDQRRERIEALHQAQEKLRADLDALQKRYGPPQPRAPQKGQLGLPIDGGGGDDDAPEGVDE